ncbi:hypothetical protein VEE68_33980 [Escherichia coli]|nr:hypothetical protein VEE68_33980 [Escherichia coli]
MVKIGIFGILKVAMDLLAQTGLPLWWGILVMAIGAISALLGVLYALAEQDIKRLLAWSTVENVGIILLAVGVAMVGLSLHDPLLTVVGLLGALFHLLNHALFKGLLFLGAGAIISRLHTHDMEKMGALAKRMPWTAGSMPDWLPRDISHSSAEWFYQRMVHLAVAVLTKSCGSRSATTCGSYCYGDAGSHWWAGSNVLRQNVRHYFLWCAAQYTR